MAELDLIPADYAQRQSLRRQLKRFAAALAVVGCSLGLARSAVHLLTLAEKSQVARLQEQERALAQTKAKVEDYRSRKLATEKQLMALDELRGRDRLRLFLKAVDAAFVENVWFDEMRYYRREILPPGNVDFQPKNLPKPPATGKEPEIEQRVEIVGHAINHVTLAEFMRRLEGQPGIADVSLVDTRPRAYPNALVIDLKLWLLIHEKVRGRP
jgi:hypothetical protein